jgi:hypothetical protein
MYTRERQDGDKPVISGRVSRELYDKIKHLTETKEKSYADILKAGIEAIENRTPPTPQSIKKEDLLYVSKQVKDTINRGLQDIHRHLKELPDEFHIKVENLPAHDDIRSIVLHDDIKSIKRAIKNEIQHQLAEIRSQTEQLNQRINQINGETKNDPFWDDLIKLGFFFLGLKILSEIFKGKEER